jgi:hypothetical protein
MHYTSPEHLVFFEETHLKSGRLYIITFNPVNTEISHELETDFTKCILHKEDINPDELFAELESIKF